MKQARKFLVVAVLLLLGAGALAQEADAGAMDQVRQQWADLYNQGDLAGVANLYAEDARLYDAAGEVAEGRQAVQDSLQQELDDVAAQMGGASPQITIEATDTQVLDDTAYEVGTFNIATQDGQTLDSGHYMVVSRMMDGEWRIVHHMSTSSMLRQMMQEMGGGGGGATDDAPAEPTEEPGEGAEGEEGGDGG